jgi:tetratricopeptide (TPR) repeat protein
MTPGLSPREVQGRIQLLFPDSRRELGAKYPFLDLLLPANTGRPLFLARIFSGLERVVFTPEGSAYRVLSGWDGLNRANPEAEYVANRRRMRVRGIFSGAPELDQATQQLLSGYVVSLYWRGYGLMFQGKFARAESMLMRAMAWPDLFGADRAALHGSIAWCREKRGDMAGARSAYAEAVRLEPSRVSLLKPYAELLLRAGNKAGALALYRRIAALSPGDAPARARVMELVVE